MRFGIQMQEGRQTVLGRLRVQEGSARIGERRLLTLSQPQLVS